MIEPTTWEHFKEVVNRAGFAWQNLLGQDRMYPWTPVDASGAALTFTSVDAWYMRIGRLTWVSATLIYPATADVSNSVIGGFPFVAQNSQGARVGTLSFHNGATAVKFFMDANARTGQFYTAAGANVTNAQMATAAAYFNAIYPIA